MNTLITVNVVIGLLLGHFWGDYMLQPKWMAMNKSGTSWICFVHSIIYSGCITLFTFGPMYGWNTALEWKHGLWFLIIFASHFPIDRWNLADRWLLMIDGRSLRDFMNNGKYNIPAEYDKDNYHVLRGGFAAMVYAVVDNTMHFTIMWYGLKLMSYVN